MNKKKHTVLLVVALLFIVNAASASADWFDPVASGPASNVALPLNNGPIAQLKNGGLSVDNFIANAKTLLLQNVYFNGAVYGGTPSDTTSTLRLGQSADLSPTDFSIKGALTASSGIATTLFKNTQNTVSSLCSDNGGNIVLCSQGQKDYCSNIAGDQSYIPYGMIYEKGGTCRYKDSAVALSVGGCDFIDKEGINTLDLITGVAGVQAGDVQQYRPGKYWLKLTFNIPPRQDTKVSLLMGSSIPGWRTVWAGYRTYDNKFSIFEGSPLLSTAAKTKVTTGTGSITDDFRWYLPRGIFEIPAPMVQDGSGQLPAPLEIIVPANTREVTVPDLFCEAVGGGNKLLVSYINKIQYKFTSVNAAENYNFILSPTFNVPVTKLQ